MYQGIEPRRRTGNSEVSELCQAEVYEAVGDLENTENNIVSIVWKPISLVFIVKYRMPSGIGWLHKADTH